MAYDDAHDMIMDFQRKTPFPDCAGGYFFMVFMDCEHGQAL
jgi:hypothetical protein